MGILDSLFPTAQAAPTLDGILAGAQLPASSGNGPDLGTLAQVMNASPQPLAGMTHEAYQPPQLSPTEQAVFSAGMAPVAAVGSALGGLYGAARDIASGDLQRDAWGASSFAPQTAEGGQQDAQADVAGRSLAAVGSLLGPSALEPKPAGAIGIFGGRNAATADTPGLQWFFGADGKMRFEIPDYGATISATAPEAGKLPEMLDHPELYDAYPHFADMTYAVKAGDPGWSGSYSQAKNHIDVAPSDDPNEMKAAVLHELQHGVQASEGFARGGDALTLEGGMDAYHRLMGEVEARNVETRMRMPPDLLGAIPPAATESVRRNQQLLTAPSIFDALFGVSAMHVD